MKKWDTFQEALKILMKIESWFVYVLKIGEWLGKKINIDLFSYIEWENN